MTSVKYFHSAMSGAPTLNAVAGTLINVLDACLVNGFNLKTVDSLVVSSNVATATISTGVGAFEADTVVNISGATPSGLNGDKRIISVTANTITFAATGISNQTATGTITAKLASAGWEKVYSGTNLAVYRSQDVTGTREYLRVDDTAGRNGRIICYESMSDVNTGTGRFPLESQISGGYWWPKADAATAATARAWTIIADSRTFYIHTNTHTTTTALGVNGWTGGFGDFTSVKPGDAYSCAVFGATFDTSATSTSQVHNLGYSYATSFTNSGIAVARSYTGLGGSILPVRRAESMTYGDAHSGWSSGVTYPNPVDNSLILSRMAIVEMNAALRGFIRGLLYVPQSVPQAAFNWRDKLDGTGAYAGRKLMAIKSDGSSSSGTNSNGTMVFDITGPWS